MKLLTAPARAGQEPGDFTWCIPGEIVAPDAYPRGAWDTGKTRHYWGFIGLGTRKTTTTAVVADVPISEPDLRTVAAGWLDQDTKPVGRRDIRRCAWRMQDLARRYDVGTVVRWHHRELVADGH